MNKLMGIILFLLIIHIRQDLNSFNESNVESLVEHILKLSSNTVKNNEDNTLTSTENKGVVTESDNSYSEVCI